MSSAHDMSTLPCASTSAVDSTTRVDFISELPFEIVMDNIIPRIMRKEDDIINLRDRECYFAVCTMWSKRIAASDDNIHFHIYSNNAFLHADWMRVEAVAEHLKTLTVAASNHKAMSNLIQHGHFASLTDLTMIVEHFQSQWIKLLQSTSSVKYLHIKPEVKGKVLQIFNMLEQCPQIIQLKLSLNCPCKITCSMDHYAVYPMIRHLELVIGRSNADLVPQLFKHFPGLRVLRLSIPIASYENMDMIRHYFPKLQQLVLGGDYDVHDPEKGLFQQADLEGLRLLSIQSSFHGDSTARLLQQYATTVESVEMLTLPSSIPSIRSLLDDPVVLYRLRSLRYHADVRFHRVDFIQWIILRAPNIQFVEAISGGVEGTLLQMLTHRHVKRINLEWSTLSMSQGQHEFLQHHVHLGKTSPLLDLKCDIVWPFTGRECWLYLIPELQQLKSLEIFVAYYDRDEDEWINLLSHVARGCSSLEKITFTFSTFCSPREWILPLSQHPHLKSLVIVSGVVSNDMLPTLEHFRHLESLHLKLRSFDWKAIAGLKSKMPRLVCTTQNAHQ